MKVSKLIKKLQKLPQDALVVCSLDDCDFDPVIGVETRLSDARQVKIKVKWRDA